MDEINKRVRRIRKQAKYTQAEMAKFLNMKTGTYCKKERCGKFTGQDLLTLAKALGLDLRVFFYDDKEMLEPRIFIPDECYVLNSNEADLLTMYRNLSKKNKGLYIRLFLIPLRIEKNSGNLNVPTIFLFII